MGFTVDVDNLILDFQCLIGQTYTTFHIVLSTVYRAAGYITIFILLLRNEFLSDLVEFVEQFHLLLSTECTHSRQIIPFVFVGLYTIHIAEFVEVVWIVDSYCIASRVVEHNNISIFYLAQAFHATVFPMWPLDVWLCIDDR